MAKPSTRLSARTFLVARTLLATLAIGSSTAVLAGAQCVTKTVGGECVPGFAPVDVSTGLPYNISGGGGGGSGGTATTAAPTYTNGQTGAPLSLDTSGNLRVIGSFSSGGTATTAAPTYSNNQTGAPLSLDTSGSLRVTSSALPLPAGAATSAAQTTGNTSLGTLAGAVGTAGSPASSVLTVQGVAGATPQIVNPADISSLATAQVTTAATATQLVAARTGRKAVTIVNHGTTNIFIGTSAVTATTGLLLPGVVGASVTLNSSAAIYGITASGSQLISEIETF